MLQWRYLSFPNIISDLFSVGVALTLRFISSPLSSDFTDFNLLPMLSDSENVASRENYGFNLLSAPF